MYSIDMKPRTQITVLISLAVIFLISLIDLTGWIFNISAFDSFGSGWVTMKAITAVCFICSGAAMLLVQAGSDNRLKTGISRILAAIIGIISLLTIAVSLNLIIRGVEAQITLVPFFNSFLAPGNRMALITSVIFLLSANIFVLLSLKKQWAGNVAHILVFPLGMAGYLMLISYILNAYSLQDLKYEAAPLNSTIALCALCVIILLIRPRTWLMKVFSDNSAGGIIARRLLPGLVLLPILIGWLSIYGEHKGLFRSEYGVALVTLTYSTCFVLLVWFIARSVILTDQKRIKSEEALRTSESNFRAILDATKESIYMFDREGRFVVSNITGAKRLNLTIPEFTGHPFSEYMSEELACSQMEKLTSVFKSEKPIEFEDERNGMIFNHNFYPVFEGGKVIRVVAYSQEITERKKAETELMRSRQEWIDTFDIIPDLISIIDTKHKVVRANKAMLEKLGVTAEEISGTPCFNCVHGTQSAPSLCPHTLTLLDGKQHIAEVHEDRLGGDFIVSNTPMFDKAGKIIGSVHVARDITERKKAEEALKATEERVKLKLEGILSPEGDIGILSLADIIDVQEIQILMDNLYKLVRIPMAIIDDNGKVLVGVGWRDICTKFHRINKETSRNCIESDTNLTKGIPEGEFRLYKCRNGMWDIATPMFIGGRHIGNLFMGQFFFDDEPIDYEFFRKQATKFGFDEKEYISALEEVPRLSKSILESAKGFFLGLSRSLSKLSYSNIKLARNISERERTETKLLQLNRTLNSIGKSSKAMMLAENELSYLDNVCRIIVKDCGHALVWIGYTQNDSDKTVTPVSFSGFEEGYMKNLNITWADTERGRGPTGTAIRTGKTVVCPDMQTDPSFKPWRGEALKRGYASSIVLPLIAEETTFGALSIYSKETNPFSEDEVNLLSTLANDLAYGISYIRLIESEKKATKSIRESEEKYRLLFHGMTEGFALHEIITDNKGNPSDYRFLSVNPAFENQTGLVAENIIGRKVTEVLPGTEKYWIDIYGKVALTGESIDFENYHSELQRYFRVSAFSPQKGFFAVIFENITNRILAEKELKETKNYLENLINYSNTPIIVWNTKNEIQLFNHAFEHLTGYSASEVEGKKIDFLFPETSLKESKEKIRLAITENLEIMEIPVLTKKMETRVVLWNSAKIYDNDGEVLSTIAQGNDITERITAEEAVKKAKDKLDLALENGNIGIWEWDLISKRFEWDVRMKRMFGMKQSSKEKTYAAFERNIVEEDRPHTRNAFRKAIEEDIPFETIFRIRLKNDAISHISTKALVEKDHNNKPVKLSGVCFDITDMKRGTENVMFRLNEDLLRSNKELEQFAYIASHDLQEPLRMVSSFTQLLSVRYKDKLDKNAQEFIQYAVDGAVRMQGLINDLLEYSRIETRGKMFSAIDLHKVLGHTIKNLSILIKEKNAVIINDELPAILADEGQMIQLFQNLIGNAIKFCDTSPLIHISCKEEKENYVFTIKDNGIGMEPQYFNKIFQIFQRLREKDEYGGTGIGLAICKRIVERHEGKIWVESKPGKGSTFYFSISKNINNR